MWSFTTFGMGCACATTQKRSNTNWVAGNLATYKRKEPQAILSFEYSVRPEGHTRSESQEAARGDL